MSHTKNFYIIWIITHIFIGIAIKTKIRYERPSIAEINLKRFSAELNILFP